MMANAARGAVVKAAPPITRCIALMPLSAEPLVKWVTEANATLVRSAISLIGSRMPRSAVLLWLSTLPM
jgi:hypothetical protein